MKFSFSGTMNLGWDDARDAVLLGEDLGFEDFYASDHLMAVAGFDAESSLLDAVGLLLALGPLTRRIRLGCLVSPVSFRDPLIMLRQLQTLDVITGGRAIMGVGAGWSAEEHAAFDVPFPPIGDRLDALESACTRARSLWSTLRPRAPQEHIRMLVAGASPRLLRMTARYADVWHILGTPAFVEAKMAEMRAVQVDAERIAAAPLEVSVTLMATLSHDRAVVEATRRRLASTAASAASSGDRAQKASALPGEDGASGVFVGGPEELRELIARYDAVGVDRLVLSLPRPYSPAALTDLAHAAMG